MYTKLPCCICGSTEEARKGFLPIDAMAKAKSNRDVFMFNICRQCIARLLVNDLAYQIISVKELKKIMV